jgi:hypothetical protein
MQQTARNMQLATRNMQHATCSLQQTARNVQLAKRNMQHATQRLATRSAVCSAARCTDSAQARDVPAAARVRDALHRRELAVR